MKYVASAALALGLAGCAAAPPSEPPQIGSFGDFKVAAGTPHYLACPENYCASKPNEITPLERVPAADMRNMVRRALDAEPRTELLSSANEGLRLVYRQDSGMFSAGGTMVVEIVDVDEGISGLVLYGEGDAAAARRRVRQWIVDIYAVITEDLKKNGAAG